MFGDRNEAVGRDELAAGVFPAQQGLGSDDLAGAQVDLRLIDDGQFAPLEGLAQVAQQGGALACRLADEIARLTRQGFFKTLQARWF